MGRDARRYELVEGVLLVSPAPTPRHQRCVAALTTLLYRGEADGLVVLPAPCEWVVDGGTVLQPDVLVVRGADLHETSVRGTPRLVVEVLSQSTRLTDLGAKRLAFQTAGVPVYWIIDPELPALTVLHLEQGQLVEAARVIGNEPYRASEPFPVTIVPAELVRGA